MDPYGVHRQLGYCAFPVYKRSAESASDLVFTDTHSTGICEVTKAFCSILTTAELSQAPKKLHKKQMPSSCGQRSVAALNTCCTSERASVRFLPSIHNRKSRSRD